MVDAYHEREVLDMPIVDNLIPRLDHDRMDRYLRRYLGPRTSGELQKELKRQYHRCLELIEPKGIYEVYEIDRVVDSRVFFKNEEGFQGVNVARILKGSKISCIYVATIGDAVEKALANMKCDGQGMLSVLYLDAISTVALEEVRVQLCERIRLEEAEKRGWKMTCSFAPGQSGWSLEEQKGLFSMVDAKRIGVTLTDSCLMLPFKSLSGMVGIGPEDQIDKTKSACELCQRLDCPSRN